MGRAYAVVCGLAMLAMASAHSVALAQTNIYWNGPASGGTWDTTNTNWNTATATPWASASGTGSRGYFSLNTAAVSATVSGTVFANRVFSQTVTTLTSSGNGTITLVGASPVLQTEAKVASAARSVLRLQVPVSGSTAQIGGVSLDDYVEVAAGGSITMTGRMDIANSLASARLLQTGGTISVADMDVGAWQAGRVGVFSMNDGAFSVSTQLRIGRGVSTGTMAINGASAVASAPTLLVKSGDPTGSAMLSLQAGELRVNTLRRDVAGGSATFSFSGGTLRPLNGNLVIGGTAASNDLPITLSGSTARISSSDSTSIARTVTLNSKLTGSGDVSFVGSGTASLQVASDHNGATRIEGGTLALGLNGDFSSSPTIIVGGSGSSGAVLDLTTKTSGFTFGSSQTVGGIGTVNIGAGRTVASNGVWAPGNSIGSNAVTGNLTLTGTSQFELGTPGTSPSAPGMSDFTAVSGTLTLGGDLTLSDNAGADGNGFAAGGVYRLFTYGSAVSGSYASVTTNPTATTRTSLSNISLGGSGTGVGQGVFLSVYNLAAGSVASGTTVNFGTVLKNTPLSQALAITNTASSNAYSEKLGASFGASTGLASGSGSWNLLAAGGTSTALSVVLASGSAGAASGSQTLNFTSDGTGSSGLAAVGTGSQIVNLSATILDPAVASFTSGSTTTSWLVDFGSVNQNASVSPLGFSLSNLMQTAGYTADLALYDIDDSLAPYTQIMTTLSQFNNLASGSSNNYTASFSTATVGSFTNVYTLRFRSANNGTQFAGDTPQSLTLTVQGVIVVPEPDALALAGLGIGLAGWAAIRRRRK